VSTAGDDDDGTAPAAVYTVTIPRQAYTGPVTGARYKEGRWRGIIPDYSPNDNEQAWLDAVRGVQARMPDLLPLTPRAYGYRIAGLPGFDKTIAVAGITDFLALARRAKWVTWETVDDSRTRTIAVPEDLTPAALDARLVAVARGWERWRRLGQRWVPEIWVEAVGSMNSVTGPARYFGASIVSSGGTNSLTELRKLAARVADRWNRHRMRTVVCLIGDYDRKGRERLDRAVADAWALLRDLYDADGNDGRPAAEDLLRFEWVAVTPEQIGPRATGGWALQASNADGTRYEVEAVDPVELRDHLTGILRRYTGTKLLDRVVEASRAEGEHRARRLNGHAAAGAADSPAGDPDP
jgi:hypothetical protein